MRAPNMAITLATPVSIQPDTKKLCGLQQPTLGSRRLPPYADALRHETRLPVFDAITNADFFLSARQERGCYVVRSHTYDFAQLSQTPAAIAKFSLTGQSSLWL